MRKSTASDSNVYANPDLDAKVDALQAEFQRLLNDGSAPTTIGTDVLGMDEFYKVMGDFYGSGMKKHESPTRRLRQQKDSAVVHKTYLKEKLRRGEIDQSQYSLTYVHSPQKTFVIQPKEGEIDYSIAQKNPLKFFDKVLSQDLVEHKVHKAKAERNSDGTLPKKKTQKGLTMDSRLTKRAIARVLVVVQKKLFSYVDNVVNVFGFTAVADAFAEPEAQAVVQKHILSEGIKMTAPDSNQTIFKRQMSLIGEKGADADDDLCEEDLEHDPEEAKLVRNFLCSLSSRLSKRRRRPRSSRPFPTSYSAKIRSTSRTTPPCQLTLTGLRRSRKIRCEARILCAGPASSPGASQRDTHFKTR